MRRLFPAILLLLGTAIARGQSAPCPCPPAVPTPPPLWSGKAELSYLSTSGNTTTNSFGGGLDLQYKPAPWTFTLKAAYLRASSKPPGAMDTETTAETLTGELHAARDLTTRVDLFVGAQYLRNRFAGIRGLVGGDGGAGYKLLLGPVHSLRAEAGIGYTHESQLVGGDRNYASARAALAYKWTFSKTADFTNEFAFLEDLSDSSNWIVNEKAAISAALTSLFSLKASWTLVYDHVPVTGFRNTDTATSLALVAKF
jgi:putative salt-induced outer membrane protein